MSLLQIQQELKAPKGQLNKFGGYSYRSCEDILEALKPVLAKHEGTLIVSDDMVQLGDRFYIRATSTLTTKDGLTHVATGWAREALDRKGMDDSQITGSASSYARKYSLNGLFLIDDTKDADATNDHGKGQQTPPAKPPTAPPAKPPAKEKPAPPAKAPTALEIRMGKIKVARTSAGISADRLVEMIAEMFGKKPTELSDIEVGAIVEHLQAIANETDVPFE